MDAYFKTRKLQIYTQFNSKLRGYFIYLLERAPYPPPRCQAPGEQQRGPRHTGSSQCSWWCPRLPTSESHRYDLYTKVPHRHVMNEHTKLRASQGDQSHDRVLSTWHLFHEGGRLWLRGRVRVLLSEVCWFDSPGLQDSMSLGKILNPKLLLTCSSPSAYVCMNYCKPLWTHLF